MDDHPLKIFRKGRCLSQRGLAALLGVSNAAVSRWESGERKLDADMLPLIVERTGIPARELRPDLAALMRGDG